MDDPTERLYRIPYPTAERPVFDAGGSQYDVIDCSETGVRYRVRGVTPDLGTTVDGVIRFRRDDEVEVEGEVVRIYEGSVGLKLTPPGIPLRIIIAEQLFLRKHYPAITGLKII